AAIAASDGRSEGERWPYYESWLGALQKLLVERGILTAAEIEDRMRQFATGQRDIVHPGAP
ncbi:MAG TPA: hypothetical protein VGA35_08315, partial [bacterium]